MRPTLANLKTDRLLWARVIFSLFQPPADEIPGLASAAFEALDHWDGIPTEQRDDTTTVAINGAFNGIQPFVNAYPDTAYLTCRRIGTYFQSKNINVAFTAIRQFEFPAFSSCAIFVSDMLISVATSDTLPKSPIEMTLRGIAFRALFALDPQYKYWPQLRAARDECVHGLLTWGGGRQANRRVAAQIMRYIPPLPRSQ